MKAENVQYYHSFTDDVVTSKNQNKHLPKDYKWLHTNVFYQLGSAITYAIAWLLGFCYCKLGLHLKVKNRQVIKKYQKSGFFLYGNHTQPIGDVVIPLQVALTKRAYVIASEANLGIPVIGQVIPMMGGLVIPGSLHQMRAFTAAVGQKVQQGHFVTIYPEAHVWPYYTKIRPFSTVSFHYPVQNKVPAFCMTTTYQKRRFGQKPRLTLYVDGPFLPDQTLSKKAQQEKLCKEVHACMVQRSQNSTYEYVKYEKR
ncbi:hypothetical protein BSQ39_11530 [Loigolactobacillus backii]|uniref:1-acyl-sn-glycerol-3-phosphate acyltransferase n=1 Tax=Loigolactobacillus backii TaxID=375175 RepID=UPI0007F0E04E|nr:1-acyl-sn-glycerol-3-phosphate acyltransferase [Loigolactobacillus backii]ANK58883.1 hypothetical protein AYR52_00545 [Loigolactobacillus backii]ANK63872.1 hypothetical protein AYR54_00535 [Loigolactobacillus backii]ANK66320.1 hypothetical protein AYR55_00540 [Loigolactobacillus backii]OLF68385.1 hypothetical protein ACX53_11800 [Loigolactobacillus backii]PIO84145.1 hypothetical protein BSQ39_11530 [Loigolactobacillus backii]